jgi:MoaA/NifB/PqqE/SkfB family radical SAM enzyme
MSIRMSLPLVVHEPGAGHAPVVPFLRLSALWIQITGTWCNLECTHCINASGPNDPWLKPIAPEVARAVAPTTVLTNGTLIDEDMADRLAALARGAAYSLEIRVSLDDTDPEKNDRVRGAGAFDKAVRAIQLLHERGLLPIVTATEITSHEHAGGRGMYERFRGFLAGLGIEKPRVKIMPVFALGRSSRGGGRRLTEDDLEGFDRGTLQCSESRVVADGGVYACPILAGLPGAKLSDGGLEASFRDAPLYHPSCVTCHETGMTCKNG